MLKINELARLYLGIQGENGVRSITVDVSAWINLYPNGSVTVWHKRCGDSTPSPTGAVYDSEEQTVTWDITSVDTFVAGIGEAEFRLIENDVIKKTAKVMTGVSPAVTLAGTELGSDWASYINAVDSLRAGAVVAQEAAEDAQEAAEEAQEAAEDAQEAAEGAQTAAETAQGKAEDAQTAAEAAAARAEHASKVMVPAGGTEGQRLAKKSGADFDMEWKTDPYYTKPAGGIPATDLEEGAIPDPTSIIDGSSTAANKVWPASKTNDLLSAIDKLIPDATASDVGKAIIVKTVADGKPSSYEYGEAGGGSVDPQDIADAVADWCEENITEDPTVVIDKSLSVSGAAAEAKTVGDALDMQETTKDLLAIATKSAGYKIDSDGNKASSSNYDVFEIAYDGSYATFNATLYSNSNYQMKAISFQNSQGTVLSTLGYPATTGASTFTNQAIPSGTAKILLNNKRSMGDPACTCATKYSKRLKDIEEAVEENANIFNSLQHITKNLYDVSKATNNYILVSTNGTITASSGHIVSDYIPVDEKTIYSISAKQEGTLAFSTQGLRYAFYNSSKEFISGFSDAPATTFRTPANAAFIRFSMYNDRIEVQFERRHFATKYAPYDSYVVNDESDKMFLNYPAKLYAVTGLQYNYYMFNVTPEQYSGQFTWDFNNDSTKMQHYGRFARLQSNNTSASDIACRAKVRSLTKCADKGFVIKVTNPANLQNVSVLILGDSTTANGFVATDLHGYSGNENKISTLGTCGTAPYNHEGRSGWTLNMYFTTSTNNPFYNPSTQTFDAEYYFSNSGVSVPDIFIINLGINDMHYDSGNLYDAKATADAYIEKVNAVIESLRLVSATMKIAICMTIPPNVDPWGFGAAGTNIIGYDAYRIANLVLCEKLIDEFDYRESEGLYLIPINSVLDTKYNMPTSAQLPNSRASETIMLPDTAGNVHPNQGGYYQIADEIYAFLCWLTAQ